MGNNGSYLGNNTTINPFIMIDGDTINSNNRFACDIDLDSTKNTILLDNNQRVKDYTLSKMLKDMVINYDGSKEIITNSNNLVVNSKYINSSSDNLPSGIYRDNTESGNPIPVYKYMACCKGAIGPNAIDSTKRKVEIPIATISRPNKEILKPIYADVLDSNNMNKFLNFDTIIKGTNSESFSYDKNYKDKINSLTDTQLDSIIYDCANNGTCIKSNYIGLQIKTNTDNDIDVECNKYIQNGQNDMIENANANLNANCHSLMRHICAKQLYDQGCIGIDLDKNGNKYPAWIDGPTCRIYNSNTTSKNNDVIYLYSGSPDCTCINGIHGYSLNNKPKYIDDSNYENPYNLSKNDTELYTNNGITPYSLNIWNNNPYDELRGDGDPANKDGNCINQFQDNIMPYVLPKYYISNTSLNCTDNTNIDGNIQNIIMLNKFNITDNCDIINAKNKLTITDKSNILSNIDEKLIKNTSKEQLIKNTSKEQLIKKKSQEKKQILPKTISPSRDTEKNQPQKLNMGMIIGIIIIILIFGGIAAYIIMNKSNKLVSPK